MAHNVFNRKLRCRSDYPPSGVYMYGVCLEISAAPAFFTPPIYLRLIPCDFSVFLGSSVFIGLMGALDQVWRKALLRPRQVQTAQGPIQVATHPSILLTGTINPVLPLP